MIASGLNMLLVLVPFAWASHFCNSDGKWPHHLTFARTCPSYATHTSLVLTLAT